MDASFKNRLVGTIVILALAALVLPWLFDGANHEALLAESRLPPPPDVPAVETLLAVPPPETAAVTAEIDALHAAATPEVPAIVIPPVVVTEPATPDRGEPAAVGAAVPPSAEEVARLAALAEAWDVQVAAFSSPEGAHRLREALLAAGYKARVRDGAGGGRLQRVLVGPVLRRADAEALKEKLANDKQLGLGRDALLVRYVP